MTAVQAVAFEAVTDEDRELRVPRTIRIEPTLWEKLGPAAGANGHDRSALVRQLIRWYLTEPGAQLPARPSPASQRPDRTED